MTNSSAVESFVRKFFSDKGWDTNFSMDERGGFSGHFFGDVGGILFTWPVRIGSEFSIRSPLDIALEVDSIYRTAMGRLCCGVSI